MDVVPNMQEEIIAQEECECTKAFTRERHFLRRKIEIDVVLKGDKIVCLRL